MPVISQKCHNDFIAPPHRFKIEGLHALKDLLRPGDWMTKADLKDAYFIVPIHDSNRPDLHFSAMGPHYQFTRLPFGLSSTPCSTPWVFTKTLKPATVAVGKLLYYHKHLHNNL